VKKMRIFLAMLLSVFVSAAVWGQTGRGFSSNFPPFEQWKSAVLAGDETALKQLYSTNPPAQVRVKGAMHDAAADTSFWLALKPSSMKVDVVRNEPRHGHISFIFRATVISANGETNSVTEDQSWQQQGERWRLISVERTDDPSLAQPSNMKKDLYPADADAHAEIREAERKAADGNKRLLLVFGANWCFDCHVLDLAFHRPDLAPIVEKYYEVVHVDIGPDGEKNSDLVRQYEIPLNKGVPALAITDSHGKLIVTEKNGEFEDARQLTPQFLMEFLNKWRPESR
jgi:thioredoxin 1